jgi:hypothetical protein
MNCFFKKFYSSFFNKNQDAESTDCSVSLYGCCSDGITLAVDLSHSNCPIIDDEETRCDDSEYGCCSDGVTLAKGPFREGCIDDSCQVNFLVFKQ